MPSFSAPLLAHIGSLLNINNAFNTENNRQTSSGGEGRLAASWAASLKPGKPPL